MASYAMATQIRTAKFVESRQSKLPQQISKEQVKLKKHKEQDIQA
jgi:hypothetical protein